jgi:transposase-like protein
MKKRRNFTAKFKAEVVLEVLTGVKSAAQVCREHKLNSQVLGRWKTILVENAPSLFEGGTKQNAIQQRTAELEQMVGRLTMELEAAKKASGILNSRSTGNGW